MSAGMWIAPAALAAVFVILWVAAWLERLVVLPALYPEPQIPDTVGTGFADPSLAQSLSVWPPRPAPLVGGSGKGSGDANLESFDSAMVQLTGIY
jgi:hypothetical protein